MEYTKVRFITGAWLKGNISGVVFAFSCACENDEWSENICMHKMVKKYLSYVKKKLH